MTLAFDDRFQIESPAVPTTQFTVGFPIFSLTEGLAVYIDGEETEDFTVSGTAVDGMYTNATVTLNESVYGMDVWLVGDLPPAYPDDIINGPTLTRKLNASFARKAAEVQELRRDTIRSLKLGLTSTVSPDVPDGEIGQFMQRTASGVQWAGMPAELTDVSVYGTRGEAAAAVDASVELCRWHHDIR